MPRRTVLPLPAPGRAVPGCPVRSPRAGRPPVATRLVRLLPGLGLTGAIACVALRLAPSGWLQAHGIGALTVALLLGMGVGHAIPARHASAADEGAAFSRVRLLRLGIVLYGLRLTFQDIAGVGWAGIAIDAAVLCSTFGLACCLGTRVFGLDRRTTLLIGAGSSICGATAVMATAPVVRGRAGQVTVAVATVVVFGTLAIFLYPVLYRLDAQYRFVGLSPAGYGMFAGSTIHEVAQVVAAGRAGGAQAADAAVVAKMVRVIMLAPFLMLLSAWLARHPERRRDGAPDAADDPPGRAGGIAVPWFALGFVAVAGLHSAVRLPAAVVDAVHGVDTVLLAMTMGGLGLGTRVSALRTAGIRPLALAAVLFGWLVCGGLAINRGLAGLLG